MRVWVLAALAAAAVVASSSAQAADQGSLKVAGTKQGQMTGAGVPVLDFNYSVAVPMDAASGLPTGRRQQKPLTVTLPWTAAAPQLYTAAVTSETLSSVVFAENGAGARFTMQLSNARITGFEVLDANGKDPGVDPVVKVTFTFQKIEISDVAGGKSAADDWEARP